MTTSRILLVPALLLVACQPEDGGIHPIGVSYQYVVSQVTVPTSSAQVTELGLDLDGDDIVDNRLGAIFAALVPQGIDVQGAIEEALDRGDILLLVNLQTPSFSSSGGTGFQVKLGDKATARPAPCTDAADTVCRKHLAGTGSFAVAAGSPADAAVAGKIVGGTFNGGPGNLSLEIALGGPGSVRLDLIGARVKASGMSAAGIDSVILAGGLPDEDLIPTVYGLLAPMIAADCPGTTPPDCGCATGSTGRTFFDLFDTSPKDCVVTIEEIQNNPTVFRDPGDLVIDGQRVHSFGIEVSAVRATIR